MSANKKPNPGSKKAQELGCTCPVIDNHYGRGILTKDGPAFWISGGCPVHTSNVQHRAVSNQLNKVEDE